LLKNSNEKKTSGSKTIGKRNGPLNGWKKRRLVLCQMH